MLFFVGAHIGASLFASGFVLRHACHSWCLLCIWPVLWMIVYLPCLLACLFVCLLACARTWPYRFIQKCLYLVVCVFAWMFDMLGFVFARRIVVFVCLHSCFGVCSFVCGLCLVNVHWDGSRHCWCCIRGILLRFLSLCCLLFCLLDGLFARLARGVFACSRTLHE